MITSVRLLMRDYDYLAPLGCGDVLPDGLELTLERDTPGALDRTLADPSVQAGELSFSRHIQRLAAGDRGFVGVPFFAYRAFRQRCFFVRQDSGLGAFADLRGKRIGTNEWPASGNTWSRAILREAGVRIDEIRWWVGSVDGGPSGRPQRSLPPWVRPAPAGWALRDMLLDGELDALMCPLPPRGFYDANSTIVRLVPDFRRAERDYFRRTGIYPGQHVVGVRRQVFDRAPEVAARLFAALEQSKLRWQQNRWGLSETLPWTLAEIEEATMLMGQDWHPNGVEPNRKMIQAFLDEQVAQELIPQPLPVDAIFTEFQEVARA
jgi:4,5-dihydroxyphthalate decarboxylase